MFYNHLFRENSGTGINKLGPEEFSRFRPNNSQEIKYKQNNVSSCYFWSLAYTFAAIGDFYAEE